MGKIPLATILLTLFLAMLQYLCAQGDLDPNAYQIQPQIIDLGRILFHQMVHNQWSDFGIAAAFLMIFGVFTERKVGALFTILPFFVGAWVSGAAWAFFASSDAAPLIGAWGGITALSLYFGLVTQHPASGGFLLLWGVFQFFLVNYSKTMESPVALFVAALASGFIMAILVRSLGIEAGSSEEHPQKEAIRRYNVYSHPPGSRQTGKTMAPETMTLPPKTRNTTRPLSNTQPIRMPTAPIRLEPETKPETKKKTTQPKVGKSGAVDPDEAVLHQALENNPNDIESRRILVEIYIKKGKKEEALDEGQRAMRLLCEDGQSTRAFMLYSQIQKTFGAFDVNALLLQNLLQDRLGASDVDPAIQFVSELIEVDPQNRHLPEYLSRLARVLVSRKGAESPITKEWVQYLFSSYPGHPLVVQLKTDLADVVKDKTIQTKVTVEEIEKKIKAKAYPEVAKSLIDNDDLISDMAPLPLYSVAQHLVENPSTLPQGVMLLELTIRRHLDHPSIPNLAAELVGVYFSKLHNLERARQWRDFMQERWPDSQANRQIREMIQD